MHFVTRRSNRMQKHKFGVTCPGAIFVESLPISPKHEKLCTDVSCPRCTEMHYVTHRYHQRQKHKFGVTSHDALFVESEPVPPQHDK
jgi:hypothetical protein